MQRNKTLGVLLFYAVILTVALLVLLAKVPIRIGGEVVSSGWQVAALGDRLDLMAERTRLSAPVAAPLGITWGFSAGCTAYRGLVTLPHPGGESQLWLWARPEARRELRNPARRPLPGMTLVRDALRSDLVASSDPGRGWVGLRMVSIEEAEEQPSDQLLINNFVGQRALPTAGGVNRGLEEIAGPAQCNYLDRDSETVELLTAVLRLTLCDPEEPQRCHATALTLYRDLVPDVYRLEARALEAECGRMAARLRVNRDDAGRPTGAGFEVIEGATRLQCLLHLDAVSPAPPGRHPERTRILGRLPDGGNKRGSLDFMELLDGTGWR